jgi:hypothetical protein
MTYPYTSKIHLPVTDITDVCLAFPLDFCHMLSEKQFRERAKTELRQIANQVLSVATDRDIYWRMEREIIQPNPQLRNARSAFLDLVRAAYADATAARVLRLLDGQDGAISLPRVLAQLESYPQLLHDRITEQECAADQAALAQAAANLKQVSEPHFAHHERTLSALAATHRALDVAIDLTISTVKTYYWIVADSYIDLDIQHAEDLMAIFSSAWAVAELAK